MKKYLLIITLFFGLHTCGYAQSINSFFMRDQPITEFTKEDVKLFKASVLDALENKQVNESINWENPETGTKGQVTVLENSNINDHNCKIVKLKNSTKKIVGQSYTYKACKQEATWQVLPLHAN